ncbi:MAG: hypothetical protein FJZ16_01255 [Candidatus Omnitrophica bacterium]|nr:hypothetical protein [Candidatus Omnitrophota bacterium]
MEQKYKIALNFGDVGFEVESTDKEWVETKEKEYFEKFYTGKASIKKETKSIPSVEPKGVQGDVNINEFYNKYIKANKVDSRPDIAVFFVYYLQKIQKTSEIKSSDVSNCFKDISYPSWNSLNYTDILNQGKRKGFLNYVNKNWSLTLTGEDFVMNTFSGSVEK